MEQIVEVIQREFVYVWYYFTVQLRQIALYYILGIILGSVISVFVKDKIHGLFRSMGDKKLGVLGVIPASILGIASPLCMYGTIPLVVYYSATNNTEAVAGYIADATGADLFELVPVEPYTSDDLDWTNRDSRVSKEHDDESLRVVELENAVPDNWDEYDTVFIGYPIWWGIAAWPVDSFISANDFTGKTVIPFCTSSSSGLGQSGELLRDAAGTGNWLEGQRFQSRASEDTVKEWVASLEL